jgi:4-hydroxy-2-oxoheptanedioate aldolase
MPAPINKFKQRMQNGDMLFGCWLSLADIGAAEIMGTMGFDWVLIDGEHAPNDVRSMREQLIALQSSDSCALVRVPVGDSRIIKQVLDIGAQTILVPMVESAEQARELVRAVRYPPNGIRGVGAAATRASRFAWHDNYVQTADEQICLLVQIESKVGVAALDEILAVDGIDGAFIGPADLSADMGFAGKPDTPEVQETMANVLRKTAAAGKLAGIMSLGDGTQKHIDDGAQMIAVAIDVVLLKQAAVACAKRWIR